MSTISPANVIVELEGAIAACSPERRARMLWQTTDLLVAGCNRLRDEQVHVLDEVLVRLAERTEPPALVQLSTTVAELKTAPRETLRHLALHNDPAVAAPVLLKSPALSQTDLEAAAMSRGELHLLAISGRSKIDEALTDVLLKRGGKKVFGALAKNPGAKFSTDGYSALTVRAERDEEIAKALVLRIDTPDRVVRELLSRVPPDVRTAILNAAPAGLRERIEAPTGPAQGSGPKRPEVRDYSEAMAAVVALNRIGKLNDSTVNRFAIRGEGTNLIAALSVLSGAPVEIIEKVMADTDCEGLVMACRASRLNWQTTLAILSNRGGPRLSNEERERTQELFDTLHLSTSQWTVRWGELAAGSGPASKHGRNLAKSGANR
jgi:uncharacterized protein (DUF2336 family)